MFCWRTSATRTFVSDLKRLGNLIFDKHRFVLIITDIVTDS